jgi:hypothetical protein
VSRTIAGKARKVDVISLLGASQVDALGPEPLPGTAEQVSSDGCSERERAGKLLQPNDVGLD